MTNSKKKTISKIYNPNILNLKEAIEVSFEPKRDPHVHGLNVKDINRLMSGNRQGKIDSDEILVDLNGTLGELVVGAAIMAGRITAHTGKYVITNGNPINILRYRGMQVWWLRELINTRDVFVVVKCTECARKGINSVEKPSLIHGETLGYCFEGREVDLVLTILESEQGIVLPEKSGTLISLLFGAVREGHPYAFPDLPDDYMFKIVVSEEYKDIDLKKIFECALQSMSNALDINLMVTLLGEGIDAIAGEKGETRRDVKIAILWRERHEDLYNAFKMNGFDVGKKDFFKIGRELKEGSGRLTEGNIEWVLHDDWSQGIEIALGDIDLLIGSGRMPGALNSAWLVTKYGGNFSGIPIATEYLYQGEARTHFDTINNFSPREQTNAKRFNLDLIDAVTGQNKICTHQDLFKGDLRESVMAIGIIKDNPCLGGEIQGVRTDDETGKTMVNVLWLGSKEKKIINLELEFETSISYYLTKIRESGQDDRNADDLYHLSLAYAEFGKWKKAAQTIQKALKYSEENNLKKFKKKITAAQLYIKGLEAFGLGNPKVANKKAAEFFQKALDGIDHEDSLHIRRFLRRIALDKMDMVIQKAEDLWIKGVEGKNKALNYIPESFTFWKEAYKYTGNEVGLMERYNELNLWEIIHNYHDEIVSTWQRKKFPKKEKLRLQFRLKKAYEVFVKLRKTRIISEYEKELHKNQGDIWMSYLLVTVFRESPPSIRNGMIKAFLDLLTSINEEKNNQIREGQINIPTLASQYEARYGLSGERVQTLIEYRNKQDTGTITNISQLFEIPILLENDFIMRFLSALIPTKKQLQKADDVLVEVETKFVRPTSLTIEEQIIHQEKQREKIQQEQHNVLDYNLEQGIFLFEAEINAYHARELIVLGHPGGAEEYLSKAIEALDRMIDKSIGYLPYVYQQKNKVDLYKEFGMRLKSIELLKKGIKALDEVLDPDKRRKRFGKNAGAVGGQDIIALRRMGELGQMIKKLENK
ncbi:fructose-1,6-bisphosphatase/sedoheptulose 1,7-bisphosphatase and related proteins [Candidatus Scalindua japonica]|uniref:Fructose-1,6-bisphosphatase/sedoheptulose 1,7-bisphosphatase and related proteins n=1 Tax=Candidatus Scalindua japonica TaxID=1284222 RepID=A0A286U4J5_9BACT|nr:fructose-bisphosphatase class II [Candidatus Scalindua japonica]GAX63045.1 fructose-1,6-bisphosphatase/sedoheptulose 1,7-bisphosphatase and related proteins [Candidatus Scalindua japonica]